MPKLCPSGDGSVLLPCSYGYPIPPGVPGSPIDAERRGELFHMGCVVHVGLSPEWGCTRREHWYRVDRETGRLVQVPGPEPWPEVRQ
jgi:hypothetical protein